jgi:hypothetical protein
MNRTFDSSAYNIKDAPISGSRQQVANGVIPSEARNLSLFKPQEKREPRHAACLGMTTF